MLSLSPSLPLGRVVRTGRREVISAERGEGSVSIEDSPFEHFCRKARIEESYGAGRMLNRWDKNVLV